MKLDIGCGTRKKEGFKGVDILPLEGVDYVCDLEKKLPFEDNSVEEIFCSHTLEHIHNFPELMAEFWRVCKPGAKVRILVPYFRSERAFRDPTHVRFFTYLTFNYFSRSDKVPHYNFQNNFKLINKKYTFNESNYKSLNWKGKTRHFLEFFIKSIIAKLANKHPHFYESTFLSYLYPAWDLDVKLAVIK